MRRLIINLVLFQIAWLACVLGAAHGLAWAGIAVAAGVIVIHLSQSQLPGREAVLILVVALIGALWDGLLVRFGFLEYPTGTPLPWLPPLWIVAMWAAFATTLGVGLSWLRGRWGLATLFGAVGGPLAFYAGHALGAVTFPDTLVAMAVLAGGWSFLMPLILWLSVSIEGARGGGRPAMSSAPAVEESSNV
jgi:hypothetical protein